MGKNVPQVEEKKSTMSEEEKIIMDLYMLIQKIQVLTTGITPIMAITMMVHERLFKLKAMLEAKEEVSKNV